MAFPFSKFFGNTIGEGAAFAAGLAIAPTLAPILRELENETWSTYPNKPADAATMALGVAQGQVTKAAAYSWGAENGYGAKVMDALVNVANVGPPLGQAMQAWRRGLLTDAQFETTLLRLAIEPQWWPGLKALKVEVLGPADLARGIHKGLLPDPGLLAVPAPSGTGNVPAYPVYQIDALAEALANGIDRDRLGVLVGLQGNPMGAHEAAQAFFRGVLEQVDFDRAIAEGNTRNEWGPAIMEQSRQIITSHEAVENTIRGYNDQAWLASQTARHGMTPEDTAVLFQNAGRPLTVHQITTALARGGTFKPEPGELTDPYEASVHESNIKPSYYGLAIANKYTLPGYFVIKAMLTDGTLTQAEASTIFKQEGWPPDLADKAAAALAGGAGQATSAVVKSHTTSAIGVVRKSYVVAQIGATAAKADLAALGVTTGDQAALVAVWDVQRRATLPTLTAAQLQKASGNTLTWQEAHDALEAQGYPEAEIMALLGPQTAP